MMRDGGADEGPSGHRVPLSTLLDSIAGQKVGFTPEVLVCSSSLHSRF